MNTLNKLLDEARKMCERDSDRAVSQRLKVSANSVFVWRKGGKITDAHLMALIDLAQADPALAVKVREEEAGSAVERKAWSTLWDRLSAAAAVVALVAIGVHVGAHEGLQAALPALFVTGPTIHYAKFAAVLVVVGVGVMVAVQHYGAHHRSRKPG